MIDVIIRVFELYTYTNLYQPEVCASKQLLINVHALLSNRNKAKRFTFKQVCESNRNF